MRRLLLLCTLLAAQAWAYGDGISIANWPGNYPVSGNVSVANWPSQQAVTGTFWPTTQPVSGQVTVSNFPTSASTAVVSRVTVGTAAVILAAANLNRRKVVVFNETGTLRVKLGANASLTDYSYEILASAGNNSRDIDGYTGIVSGIKVSGITAVQVTEF